MLYWLSIPQQWAGCKGCREKKFRKAQKRLIRERMKRFCALGFWESSVRRGRFLRYWVSVSFWYSFINSATQALSLVRASVPLVNPYASITARSFC